LLALAKADYQGAQGHFSKRLEGAQKSWDTRALFAAHTGLGLSYEGTKQSEEAVTHFRKAVEISETIRESLNEAQRTNFYDAKIWTIPRIAPYEGLARVMLKMGDPAQSFRQAEWTRARSFSEALSRRSVGLALDVPAAVAEKDRQINDRIAALAKGLETAHQKESGKEAVESFTREIDAARKERDSHVATLRKDHPLFAATKYPQPMSLDQSALRDSEWTLAYEVTDSGVCIYLVRGKEIQKALFKETSRKDLDELVRKFREPLEAAAESEEMAKRLTSFDFGAGKKLSDLLLADILELLPKGVAVNVVPDDCLGVLPFEMLVLNEGGKVQTDKRIPCVAGAEFFGDRNPLSYHQSVTALTLARTLGTRQKEADRVLALVDPVFSPNDDRIVKLAKEEKQKLLANLPKDLVMSIHSQYGLTFPRLPLTRVLGESLKTSQPQKTDLYEGMQAQKSVLLDKDLSPYGSVVFATHGYFGKDLPGIQEPVLVLTLLDQPKDQDGFLRMSDVTGLKINADIVALTACQTGLGRHISGEGTMGMGRAFQYAGAKSVLMSLWSVSETSSVKLVESFFKHLKEGKNKLQSLRLARKEIRDAGYDHPFFWAPFILVGEVQ
jgi:tetratricopeptide (TPR) repeat protein